MATPTPVAAGSERMTDEAKRVLVDQWLNQVYLEHAGQDGIILIVRMQEFLDITNLSPETCWMNSDTIDAAISLLSSRSDVLVLTNAISQRLYAIGRDKGLLADFLEDGPGDPEILMNKERRWIVAPCSNGMINVYDTAKAAEKKKANTAGGAKAKKSKRSRQLAGSHWGLLIVDRQEKRARFVDSLVNSEQTSKGKWKIRNMFTTGTAGGKVLRGLEAVLNHGNAAFDREEYDVSTLKHTPQQTRHNLSRMDEGACGPFMFKALELIYKKMSTGSEDVKAMFPSSRRDATKFHSVNARAQIRDLLDRAATERRHATKMEALRHMSREERRKAEAEPDFGYALNLDILRALLTPEALRTMAEDLKGKHTGARSNITPPKELTDSETLAMDEMKAARKNNPEMYSNDDIEDLALWKAIQASLADSSASTTVDPALRDHNIEFLPMDEAEIDQWVVKLPTSAHLTREHPLEYKLVALQKLFCGVGDEDGIQTMGQREMDEWGTKVTLTQIVGEPERNMKEMLADNVHEVKYESRRGIRKYYPDYYLKQHFPSPAESNSDSDNDSDASDHASDYDFDVETPPFDEPSSSDDSSGPSNGPGAKRRRSNEGDAGPASKRPKKSMPDFLTIHMDDLQPWFDMLPADQRAYIEDSQGNIFDEPRARIWLERVYYDTFTRYSVASDKDAITAWRDMWLRCDAGLKRPGPSDFLNIRLREKGFERMDNGKKLRIKLDLPDYRMDVSKVPDAWKEAGTTETDGVAKEAEVERVKTAAEERVKRKKVRKEEKRGAAKEAAKAKIRLVRGLEKRSARMVQRREEKRARKAAEEEARQRPISLSSGQEDDSDSHDKSDLEILSVD